MRQIRSAFEVVGHFRGKIPRWLEVCVEDEPGVFCPEVELNPGSEGLARGECEPRQNIGECL